MESRCSSGNSQATRKGLLAGFLQAGGQGVIAHFLDHLLAFVAANPGQVSPNLILIQGGIEVDIKIAPDGISALDHGLFRGLDRWG